MLQGACRAGPRVGAGGNAWSELMRACLTSSTSRPLQVVTVSDTRPWTDELRNLALTSDPQSVIPSQSRITTVLEENRVRRPIRGAELGVYVDNVSSFLPNDSLRRKVRGAEKELLPSLEHGVDVG